MQSRRLGTSGLTVSRLALGTMTWGRGTDAEEAAASLRAFRDAGGTLVDTAAGYAAGASEQLLGELLTGSASHDLVIATKAGISRRTGARVVDASRRALLGSLDTSLARLGVDHVDLWQVHAWDAAVAVEETLEALDVAVSSGRARYVGVSNYNGWQTGTAAAWQRAWPGRARLASSQVEYSLLRRGVEAEVLGACAHHGLGVLAWSPLAGGVLTGKYAGAMPTDSRGNAEAWRDRMAAYLTDGDDRIVEAVGTAARGLGTSPLGVALAWVRDRPGVSAAIVGARTAEQLAPALAAEAVTLPDTIRRALDDVSD